MYGADPLIVLEGDPSAVFEPTARQRRRLAEELGRLDESRWAASTRCDGWDVRGVIAHLDSTNTFWSASIEAGVAGTPTTFLASFDPVATPAAMVAGNDRSAPEVLDRFVASTDALLSRLEALDDAGWGALAEAPPGHVTVSALVHHALWDSWVHERDILLPLGVQPVVEPDEVAASLAYAAALSPAFSVSLGERRPGVLEVRAVDPDVHLVVEAGAQVRVGGTGPTPDLVIEGDAVELLEVLSVRADLDRSVPEDAAWLVHGLREVFDQPAVA